MEELDRGIDRHNILQMTPSKACQPKSQQLWTVTANRLCSRQALTTLCWPYFYFPGLSCWATTYLALIAALKESAILGVRTGSAVAWVCQFQDPLLLGKAPEAGPPGQGI